MSSNNQIRSFFKVAGIKRSDSKGKTLENMPSTQKKEFDLSNEKINPIKKDKKDPIMLAAQKRKLDRASQGSTSEWVAQEAK